MPDAAARVLSSTVGQRCAKVLSVVVAEAWPIARCTVTTSQPAAIGVREVRRGWLRALRPTRRSAGDRGGRVQIDVADDQRRNVTRVEPPSMQVVMSPKTDQVRVLIHGVEDPRGCRPTTGIEASNGFFARAVPQPDHRVRGLAQAFHFLHVGILPEVSVPTVVCRALSEFEAYEPAAEGWLKSGAAAAYDALKSDPSRAIPAEDVRAGLEAKWAARS